MESLSSFFLQEVKSQRIYRVSSQQVTVIGREYDCQIVLDSSQYAGVSRHHASIRPLGDGKWEVCDLDSSNGTLINGQKLKGCCALKVGDRLTLGSQGAEFIFLEQPQAMPTPVNSGSVSLTQLVPILSTGKQLGRKGFLIPGVLTVIAVVSMFSTLGNFEWFSLLLGFYLGLGAFAIVYFLCGKPKPWWLLPVLAVPGIITALMIAVPVIYVGAQTRVELESSPVLELFIHLFREKLPGNVEAARPDFISQFIAHFFGAGMMEELMKAIPIFLFLIVGLFLPRWWRSQIGVNEPLDGILIGASSAVGFTLIETLGQYVPKIAQQVAEATGQAGAGAFVGLQLLIPRVLGSVAGHVAYSGYFGYFIGLFALKPSSWWISLPVGYFTASVLHAFWNSTASQNLIVLTVVGVISYIFLVAAILKARAISPTRAQNFSTRLN
jgi:RsiW-degrading membrane proteinase PrsW (M82 family)